jgi:hypothetical protein
MSIDVAVLGGRQIRLPDGWMKQTLVSIFGGAEVDARATPGEGAVLNFVGIFGGAKVVVPAGARVTTGGFAFLGGRRVNVASSPEGPAIRIFSYTLLAGLEVTDRE